MPNFIKTGRKLLFLLADILLISLAIYLAFLLRFEGKIPGQYYSNIFGMITLSLIIFLLTFNFLKLYSFSWNYVSTVELVSLFKATALSFLLLVTFIFVLREYPIFAGFPRSTIFISSILIFIFCGGIRFGKRISLQMLQKGKTEGKERTLIVGAGDAGEQVLRSIIGSKDSPYWPLGFIDDDHLKRGETIHGIQVLGKINDIPSVVQDNQIEQMIIALPSAGTAIIKRAVEAGREAGLKKIKYLPLTEIIDGVSLRDLREIQVEDLLGRELISLNISLIKSFIQDKKIIITGAAGSIGSELSYQIAKFNPSLLLILDQDETGIFNVSELLSDKFPNLKIAPIIADIRDESRIEQIFSEYRPNVIFHAAAYKHVPVMELNPDEAVKNNILGTKIVAEAAIKYQTEKFVFISTDKAINPTSVMGATKRVGEMICQSLNQKNSTKFMSVRFGNVLDSRGSVIPIFREQIKKGGPVEVTHPEMKRYFMVNSEACLLVMQAGAMGQGGEVFVLDMGDPIKILDLAKEMIRLSGFEPDKDIAIVFTQPRPGEKLFEEILTAEEGAAATQHQKIFMVKLSPVNEAKLNSGIEKIKEDSFLLKKENIIKILKEIVPTYQPNLNQESGS